MHGGNNFLPGHERQKLSPDPRAPWLSHLAPVPAGSAGHTSSRPLTGSPREGLSEEMTPDPLTTGGSASLQVCACELSRTHRYALPCAFTGPHV